MLSGNRASPRVGLSYPKYTGLVWKDDSDRDGMGDIVGAPLGTEVTFRAAADRPLTKAWIELCPEVDQTDPITFLSEIGKRVPAQFDDDRRQTFRIVGEDEADPREGTISHVAPLARALFGKGVGEVIRIGDGEAEIISIS